MAYKETHNRWTDLWMKFVTWREHHISEKSFMVILSLVTGIVCGLAAQLLKLLIELIAGLLTSHFNTTEANWLYLVYPVAGILLTVLFVKYVVRENISHGVTKVLYAISRRKSRLKKRNIYASLIASSITIGFGGSVGAEGPIVYTGAAIGSNVGQAFRLSPRMLMTLVRRSRRYSRNFPGSDSRYAFHHRGADDRSDRPHSNAAPDFLDSRGHCGVHPRRL